MTREEYIARMKGLWDELEHDEKARYAEANSIATSTKETARRYNTAGRVRNRWGIPMRYVMMAELDTNGFIKDRNDMTELNAAIDQMGDMQEFFCPVNSVLLDQAVSLFRNQMQIYGLFKNQYNIFDKMLEKYPGVMSILDFIGEKNKFTASLNDNVSNIFSVQKKDLEPNPIADADFKYMLFGKNLVAFIIKDSVPDKDKFGFGYFKFLDQNTFTLITEEERRDLYGIIMESQELVREAVPEGFKCEFSVEEMRAVSDLYRRPFVDPEDKKEGEA